VQKDILAEIIAIVLYIELIPVISFLGFAQNINQLESARIRRTRGRKRSEDAFD
jgi:hypothetical protein